LIIHVGELDSRNGNGSNGSERGEVLRANTLIPETVARVGAMMNTAWGYAAPGAIYAGAKVLDEGGVRIEEDLTAPGLRELFEGHPEQFIGFTESDQPNGSFNSSACTFESGTLALAEEALRNQGEGYIWRFRLPFNENEDP